MTAAAVERIARGGGLVAGRADGHRPTLPPSTPGLRRLNGGSLASIVLPGGSTLSIYQPKHPSPRPTAEAALWVTSSLRARQNMVVLVSTFGRYATNLRHPSSVFQGCLTVLDLCIGSTPAWTAPLIFEPRASRSCPVRPPAWEAAWPPAAVQRSHIAPRQHRLRRLGLVAP